MKCKKCLNDKDLSQFYKSTKTKSGYRGVCIKCLAGQSAERYKKKESVNSSGRVPLPTQDELIDLFSYSCDGFFIRNKSRGNSKKGSIVKGKVEDSGYLRISMMYSSILYHRAVWKFHHGTEPLVIDHINGNRLDNRIENLREASSSQNKHNEKLRSSNRTGMYGISMRNGSYVVKFFDGKSDNTKTFYDMYSAVEYHFDIIKKSCCEFAIKKAMCNISKILCIESI